jgi:glutaredoxin
MVNGENNMRFTWSGFCIALLLTSSAHAQLYKWVGPDGTITYSDMPPPAGASKVEKKNLSDGGGVNTSNMPYELAQAVRNQPVALYVSTTCSPCDQVRDYLNKRGIPFREKIVSSEADIKKLIDLSGKQQLPFVTIGSNKQTGFKLSDLDSALTAAGYPTSSKLPPNYRNPKPEAAAPAPDQEAKNAANKPAPKIDKPSTELPPATGNAPPGFRF